MTTEAQLAESRAELAEKMNKKLEEFTVKHANDLASIIRAREIKQAWCISLYQATRGKVELPYSVEYGGEYVTKYEPYPTKIVEKSWAPGEFREVPDYE